MQFRAKTANQQEYINYFSSKIVTFGIGPAGTGKTLLAMDYALFSPYKTVILTRPIVEACGEEIGFLPGRTEDKLEPYLYPLLDYKEKLLGNKAHAKRYQEVPLAYMRGRHLEDTIIVLDEAQNCNAKQFKLLFTRLGNNCKVIVNGDPDQSDIPNSALVSVSNKIKEMEEVGIVNFTNDDIQRSTFVRRVLEKLNV